MLFRRSSPNSGDRVGRIRKPIEEVLKHPEDIRYTLKDVRSPTVTGSKLKILCRIQHTLFGRSFMLPLLSKKLGMDVLSGEFIPERATFTPAGMPQPERPLDCTAGNKAVVTSLVDNYVPDSFHRRNSLDFYNAYKSGSCSPLDVAQYIIKLIPKTNSTSRHTSSHAPLHAIVQFNEQDILRMAQASSERWENGKPLSYLDGVPVSIKGCYEVKTYQCFTGASFKPSATKSIQMKESVLVSRLKQAGAVIIGIANLQEFCAGVTGSNPNESYRTSRNPYNTNHYCGGSSSGSGSSVAAGLCTISMGSDAGGSIRIPAAHCGVVGLKPTYGLLETAGVTSFGHSVGVLGPLTASVLDVAIVMDILCPGEDKLDLSSFQNNTLDGIKLGVYWEFFEHADKEIVCACKLAIDKIISLGAECIQIKIPELQEVTAAHTKTTAAEFGVAIAPDIDRNFYNISGETLSTVGIGYAFPAVDYINSQKQRTRSIRTMEMLFDEVDVILTPATACLAPEIPIGGDRHGMLSTSIIARSMRFVALANLTGIPSIGVPVGMSSSGLPIGLQIMGPWHEEGKLIHIASKLEESVGIDLKRPKVYYDVLEHARSV